MTPTTTHLPEYLQERGRTYQYRACLVCGTEIILRYWRNDKHKPTNNRKPHVLLPRSKHNKKRYCGNSCATTHQNQTGRGPYTRTKPRPAQPPAPPKRWTKPQPQTTAHHFKTNPTPTIKRPEPTLTQWEQLYDVITKHPEFGMILAGQHIPDVFEGFQNNTTISGGSRHAN